MPKLTTKMGQRELIIAGRGQLELPESKLLTRRSFVLCLLKKTTFSAEKTSDSGRDQGN